MDKNTAAPATLIEAIGYFADPDVCLSFMVRLRWPDGVVRCPTCGRNGVSFISTRRVWTFRETHERKQFSIKVGTIFEDSQISLDKWLSAMWLIANRKNGISSYEIARALEVTQKTAWFMQHRIRLAMEDSSVAKLRGRVESDETFIGGKVRNMHESKRRRVMGSKRSGTYSKAIVMGILSREPKQVCVNVEPYHLHRYVEEQAFRCNERFGKDVDRFLTVLRGIVGRRIMYKDLIGKGPRLAPATT